MPRLKGFFKIQLATYVSHAFILITTRPFILSKMFVESPQFVLQVSCFLGLPVCILLSYAILIMHAFFLWFW